MQRGDSDAGYMTYTSKDHQHPGYKTAQYECEISNVFPSKPSIEYRQLFDLRMQLFLLYDTVISSGEMRSLPTNCTISPYHDWFLWTIGNPAVTLIFHEEYITPLQHSFRLHVSVTNTSGESKHLPAGLCIGYLLLRCN
jgi:hypothetical protein